MPIRRSRLERWWRTCDGPAARTSRQFRQSAAVHREPRIDLVKKSEIVHNPPSWRSTVTSTRTNQHRRRALALAIALSFARSEEHTSELQSLMRISYAVF